MKKYWTLLKIVFAYNLTYRTRIILGLVQSLLTPMFMLLALYFAKPSEDLTFSQLSTYYLMIAVIYSVVRSNVDGQISEMTISGEVNNFLVKPIKFWSYMLVKEFGASLVALLIDLPLLIGGIVFFGFKVNLMTGLLLPIAILLGFFLSFNFSYLIGLLSFWIDEFWAISNVKTVTIYLLGGVTLPYVFFPDWAVNILKLTPFPYMANWTVKVLQNQFVWIDFLVIFVWSILLVCLVKYFERKAILKYSFTAS